MSSWASGFSGVALDVQIAPDDSLFAASPSWTSIKNDVRSLSFKRSGRTTELDATQPGTLDLVVNNRSRTFDPAYGPASVTFDGSGGDYWAVADQAGLNGATELDIRFAISLDDWTPAARNTIVAQYGNAGNRAFSLFIEATTGVLTLLTSSDGTATLDGTTTTQFCAVNGQTVAGRVTWTTGGTTTLYIKRSTKDRVVRDARSHDGWTLIRADATAGTGALFNSTGTVRVGERGDSTGPLDGVVYYVSVATTIDDDTPLIVFWPKDAASASSTSWTGSEDGLSWTQTGSTSVLPQGTYFGRLLPGTPIRARATYDGGTDEQWYGYIRRVTLQYPSNADDATAHIQAVDALGWLLDMAAPATPYGIALTQLADPPDAYWPLHEPTTTREFADEYGDTAGMWSAIGDAGGPSQPASQAPTRLLEAGMIAKAGNQVDTNPIPEFGHLVLSFWVYLPETTSTFRVLAGTSTSSGSIGIDYGFSGDFFLTDGVSDYELFGRLGVGSHHLYVVTDGISYVQVWADGIPLDVDTASTATATTINFGLNVDGQGATVSDVALGGSYLADLDTLIFAGMDGRKGDLAGTRVSWLLDGAGIPAGLQAVTTTTANYLGRSGAGNSYGDLLRQAHLAVSGRYHVSAAGEVVFEDRYWNITATEATTSQFTASDTFVDVTIDPASIDDVINQVTVTTTDGVTGYYEDAGSISLYGPQPMSINAPCSGSGGARSLAKHIVGLRAHPHVRVTSVTFKPRHPTLASTLIPQALERKNGDRITVVRSPGGAPITAAVQIEGVQHTFGVSGEWTCKWLTSPAPLTSAEAGYLSYDHAVLGLYDSGIRFAP